MNTTAVAIAVTATIIGAVGYFAGFEHGDLLYYGLMAVGVVSLGYLFVENQVVASS